MAKMLSPALGILLLAIVLLNFASTSMPQRTLSDHHLPLSRFQLATRSQPIVASRSSSKLPAKPSSPPFAESQQLSSESDKEKKEEEKERKKEEKEREKEEKKEKKKKKQKDCSLATTIKQSNMGVLFIVSLALFFV